MAEDWARPVVAWQLQARDPEAMKAFYAQMFNWQVGDGPIMLVPAGIGGPEPGPIGIITKSDTSRVVLNVQVLDLAAAIEKAKTLGGSMIAAPYDVPNGPTIASIADPEGNVLGLVQQ
jgi:predicted enzyme related to lactoylglutathione lyase